MKKVLTGFIVGLGLISFANAEFVKNSKGERVELKDNGTWSIVKLTNDDYVLNAKPYDITLKDGNKQPVVVSVIPNIDIKDSKKLTRDVAKFGIAMTEIPIPYKLKNRYSYKPKQVYINQNGDSVEITIDYLAQNSYGADTPGSYSRKFTIDEKGNLNQIMEPR